MSKFLLLSYFICLFAVQATAQKKQTTTTPPPPPPNQQQKKPPPYVYKTEYDEKMIEIASKVNGAVNTAAMLKKEVSGKLDKVDELDAKMLQVEEILNSANFKISTTSDSLKHTRFSVEEFKNDTEAKINLLNAADGQLKYIWGVIALLLMASLAIIFTMASRIRQLKNLLHRQADELSGKITDAQEKQQKEFKDDLFYVKTRMSDDLKHLKTELVEQVNNNSENTTAQLKLIMERLDK